MDKAKEFHKKLLILTNPDARRFFLTYYSGDLSDGFDPTIMFSYFVNFASKYYNIDIDDSPAIFEEFSKVTDPDSSLEVDHNELNDFFKNNVSGEKITFGSLEFICQGDSPKKHGEGHQAEEEKKGGEADIKIRMTVIADYDPKDPEIDEKRTQEGVLLKDQSRDFDFGKGVVKTFGSGASNNCEIACEKIADTQFQIFNKGNQLLLVDMACDTYIRIQVKQHQQFVLQQNDFISFGFAFDFRVDLATSKVKPGPDTEETINLRWVPDGLSTALDTNLANPDFISDDPTLTLTCVTTGDMDTKQFTFKASQGPQVFGRATTSNVELKATEASRKHAHIFYNEKAGWVVEDLGSMSGTWLHPKNYYIARAGVNNSLPVLLRDRMVVKAHTFAMEFERA